jgi:hypothetical protein
VQPVGKDVCLKNFLCIKCKRLPIGGFDQCKSCDSIYCGNCSLKHKLQGEACLFKKCRGDGELSVANASRIVKGVVDTFEVHHACNKDSEPLVKSVESLNNHLKHECDQKQY